VEETFMALDTFAFKPASIPQAERGQRGSKYVATVEKISAYLDDHSDVESVRLELGDVSVKSAVASFRNVIAKKYRDSLRLQQRGSEVYISRR
jgi:hypothetical protein